MTVQYHGEIGVSRPRERSTAGPVSYTCVGRSEGGRKGGGGGRRRREEEEGGGGGGGGLLTRRVRGGGGDVESLKSDLKKP